MEQSIQLPSTGGGYPYCGIGTRPLDPYDREKLMTFTMTLSSDPEAKARGRRVVELIREACLERNLDRAAILQTLFTNVACRVPEFHVYAHEVIARNDRSEIDTLFDFPRKGRGRRPGDRFFFTALIDHVMNAQKLKDRGQAIAWLAANRHSLDLPRDYLPGKKALLNQYAYLHEYFQLWSSSIFVVPELLTLMPLEFPGFPYTEEMIEKAKYPPTDGSTWPYGFLLEIRKL